MYENLWEQRRSVFKYEEQKELMKIRKRNFVFTYVRDMDCLCAMSNESLRELFLLFGGPSQGKLEDEIQVLEMEICKTRTLAAMANKIEERELKVLEKEIKESGALGRNTMELLRQLMEEREVARSKPTFTKARLPSFSGVWHQGNVFQFKKKITHNLSKMEVPRDCWTFWILDRLSGPAIMIVKQTHRNLSMVEWDGVMETLIDNFGHDYQLRDSLIGQHQAVGRLAEIFPNTNWAKRSLRLRRHLAIIGEALELHCDHKKEIIDHSYSSTITSILTPKERMRMRERNFILQHTAPLEQVRLVQSEMKKLLEQSTLEAKYSIADAELIPSSDDDPDDSDKNPLFLNS